MRRLLGRRGPIKAEGLDLGIGAKLRREWQGRVPTFQLSLFRPIRRPVLRYHPPLF